MARTAPATSRGPTASPCRPRLPDDVGRPPISATHRSRASASGAGADTPAGIRRRWLPDRPFVRGRTLPEAATHCANSTTRPPRYSCRGMCGRFVPPGVPLSNFGGGGSGRDGRGGVVWCRATPLGTSAGELNDEGAAQRNRETIRRQRAAEGAVQDSGSPRNGNLQPNTYHHQAGRARTRWPESVRRPGHGLDDVCSRGWCCGVLSARKMPIESRRRDWRKRWGQCPTFEPR